MKILDTMSMTEGLQVVKIEFLRLIRSTCVTDFFAYKYVNEGTMTPKRFFCYQTSGFGSDRSNYYNIVRNKF